jgi:hypothetical protein
MKIIRKKRGKVKITHNRRLFVIIILLIILLAFLIYGILRKPAQIPGNCVKDSDCIPSGCCHPDSCTNAKTAPECTKVICTMECSGPLDCGAGSCGCINGECKVIQNK